jgi:tetratricopeptide (TPR) repeat protein
MNTMLKSFKSTALLLLVALLFWAGSLLAEDSPYADAFNEGQALEKAGKFTEARTEFEKALAVPGITPDQAGQAMLKIGGTFLSVKKSQEGINMLEKARTLKEISNQTRIQANLLFGQTGLAWSWQFPWLMAQARDAFAQIIELPEITPEQKTAAQQGIVKAFMGLKQYADARAVMAKLVASPSLLPVEKLAMQKEVGMTCMLEKKYPEARVELAKVLSMEGLSEADKVDVQLQVPVAPIPLAQMHYLAANPAAKIGMFYDDWIHPSEKSIYLAAYCIYSAITGYSPVGLFHPKSIPDEDAKALQEAAWKAVQETNPDLKPWK